MSCPFGRGLYGQCGYPGGIAPYPLYPKLLAIVEFQTVQKSGRHNRIKLRLHGPVVALATSFRIPVACGLDASPIPLIPFS